MIRTAIALVLLLTTLPSTSHALFNPGGVGLPPDRPGIDPGDPPPPPPPPPPLAIQRVGLTSIELVVRPPAGLTSKLEKQPPGGAYEAFRSVTPGVQAVIVDPGLRVGKEYCYRLTIFGGGARPDEAWVRCATTDWRVGFEGLGMSESESAEVLRLFDWRDTRALAIGTADEPALYHMNVLVEGADPLTEQGLRMLGMHVQAQPIFSEELDGWSDSQAIARDCSGGVIDANLPVANAAAFKANLPGGNLPDFRPIGTCVPIGRWLFAVVPGAIYNEIRAKMLEQIGLGDEPGIRALVFRRVADPAALPVGVSRHSLSHVYLGQMGLEFNAIQRCSRLPDGTRVCQVQQEILGWIARKFVKWVVEFADEVVEAVRSVIGRITRLIKGEVRLDLNFRLLNTDPAFGTGNVMRSGWSGEELYLKDVKIEVRQGLGAFYGHTDSQGYITLYVAKNVDTKVCIQVENDVAELTEFLIEKTICVKNIGSLSDYRRETVEVSHPYLNALAGMTDTHDYLLRTAGIDMPKITVLVGSEANELAVAGRSFTPCMGRVPGVLGLGADIIGLVGSLLNPAFLATTITVEFLYSVDMILRPGEDKSRGVPVHEYGHAVMCEMLLRQGIDAFEMAWTDIIIATSDQSAGSQASYLNEAWADFLTEQVVGGTNYFAATSSILESDINYCPAGLSCFDENFSGTSDFSAQVARIVSILHDAFDGNPQGLGANDGSHWSRPVSTDPFVYTGVADSDRGDEAVRLFPGLFEEIFDQWDDRGQLLREDSFLGGLADTMKGAGIPESEVCNLFALHNASATCPDFVARRSWLDWLDLDLVTRGTLDAFADVSPPPPVPGARSARGTILVSELVDLQPLPDPGAFQPAPCTECSEPAIFVGVQNVRVRGVGRDKRETAFAFRLGDGSFKAIDPLGQLFSGSWQALDEEGARLRLRTAAESEEALLNLLEESVREIGVEPANVRLAGKAKITLKLGDDGVPTGKVVVPFKIDVDGQTRRGSYVAKLSGEV